MGEITTGLVDLIKPNFSLVDTAVRKSPESGESQRVLTDTVRRMILLKAASWPKSDQTFIRERIGPAGQMGPPMRTEVARSMLGGISTPIERSADEPEKKTTDQVSIDQLTINLALEASPQVLAFAKYQQNAFSMAYMVDRLTGQELGSRKPPIAVKTVRILGGIFLDSRDGYYYDNGLSVSSMEDFLRKYLNDLERLATFNHQDPSLNAINMETMKQYLVYQQNKDNSNAGRMNITIMAGMIYPGQPDITNTYTMNNGFLYFSIPNNCFDPVE
jgi:hypothetical protein